MSEFDDLEKKAQDFVAEHPEQADKKIDEAADIPEHDTGYQHDEHIDRGRDTVAAQALPSRASSASGGSATS